MNQRALTAIRKAYSQQYQPNNQAPVTVRAIVAFAAQNPGLDFRNYQCGDWKASVSCYRSESRQITKDWQRTRAALRECYLADVTDEDVLKAASSAFSGRLSLTLEDGRATIDYCTGQYWPTEYRKAAASVLEYAVTIATRRKGENR